MNEEIGDQVEEGLLRKYDAVQAHLNGIWTKSMDGCPHLHKRMDDLNRCDANEMRPCVYETDTEPHCELFQGILEEWARELEICGECGQQRPGDERVKAGMKCGWCAGEWK